MCYLRTMVCQEGRVCFIQFHKHLLSNPNYKRLQIQNLLSTVLALGEVSFSKNLHCHQTLSSLTSRSLFFLGSPPASLGHSFLVSFAESQILVLSSIYTQTGDLTQFQALIVTDILSATELILPLNSRFMYLTTYSTSLLECLI